MAVPWPRGSSTALTIIGTVLSTLEAAEVLP
jgi:hypothetical protein